MFIGGGLMWVFWILLIVIIVVVIKGISRSTTKKSGEASVEILKERFARGEISQEEFEQGKKLLEKD